MAVLQMFSYVPYCHKHLVKARSLKPTTTVILKSFPHVNHEFKCHCIFCFFRSAKQVQRGMFWRKRKISTDRYLPWEMLSQLSLKERLVKICGYNTSLEINARKLAKCG